MGKSGEALYHALLSLVLRNEGIEALAAVFSMTIDAITIILDQDLKMLVSSEGAVTSVGEEIKRALLKRTSDLREQGNIVRLDDGRGSFVQPIQAGGEVLGYLCILYKEGELERIDDEIVEQAALVMALDFQKRQAVKEIERRYLNDFIRDLLEGRFESRANAFHRGAIYKWDLTKAQVLFAFKLITPSGEGVTYASINDKMLFLQKLEKVIRGADILQPHRFLVAYLGDVNAMILSPTSEKSTEIKEEAIKIANSLIPELQKVVKGQDMVVKIGISSVCYDFFELPSAFEEAMESIQMNAERDLPNNVIHYDDLGISRLLMRVREIEELERYREKYLGELIRYDREHATELLKTLDVMIKTDGNMKNAAQELFIHYNTLRYRLRRIRELSGVEFSSWEMVARVAVALQAHQLLQAREKDEQGRKRPFVTQ